MYHTLAFRCMNTEVAAWLWSADGDAARAALREVEQTFQAAHARFTRFEATSELSALNASAGRPFLASPELFEVVELALRFSAQTDGLFNPAILGALEAAGYDRTFEAIKRQDDSLREPSWTAPSASASTSFSVPSASPHASRTCSRGSCPQPAMYLPVIRPRVALDAARRTITLPAGVRLDLGGIAKGWTAQRAARRISNYGPCLVDAGGDVMTFGAAPGEAGWRIGVADPFDPERDVLTLRLINGAVATSGIDRRHWRLDGVSQHHLIDPRTGQPSESDLITVTVMAPTTVEAEVYAKAVFLLGAEAGLQFVEEQRAVAALLIKRDGHVIASSQLENYLDVHPLYDFVGYVAA